MNIKTNVKEDGRVRKYSTNATKGPLNRLSYTPFRGIY
jgi:hypothetical protein